MPLSRRDAVPRSICPLAREYIEGLRVVILNGPRQSGKTTILRHLHREHGGTFINLDLDDMLAGARRDPVGLTAHANPPVFIDEVQRAGDPLVLAVKARVDEDWSRGQFILAGSMRFLSVPGISESLAGRAGLLEVWPFSQGERAGVRELFIDIAFDSPEMLRQSPPSAETRGDYFQRIQEGGFPEAFGFVSARARAGWFSTYLTTVLERDLREVTRLNRPSAARSLLEYFAASTAQELNVNAVASKLSVSRETVMRYLDLLQTVFLIHRVPAWSRSLTAKVVKHPKIHVTDTGLAAALTHTNARALSSPTAPMRGPLIETFIVNELAKQRTWSETEVRIHHWRDRSGLEVDIVLETPDGRVVGIECKAADSANIADFRGLTTLRDNLGDAFVHGFLLHTGPHAVSFGDRLTLLPLSAMWGDYT